MEPMQTEQLSVVFSMQEQNEPGKGGEKTVEPSQEKQELYYFTETQKHKKLHQ